MEPPPTDCPNCQQYRERIAELLATADIAHSVLGRIARPPASPATGDEQAV